nr:hypothetical protein [Clostridia bacterium]
MEDFENKENNKNQDILETETLDQVSEVENNIEKNVNSTNEKNISLENNEPNTDNQEEMKLDDARRVKAVSPGLLVAKRFFRNKLALVGLAILIVLFLFCFLGSVIYKYSEKDVFTTNKDIIFDYSFAKINGTYSYFESFEPQPNSSFITNLNSNIEHMKKNNLNEYNVVDSGDNYVFTRVNDNIYRIRFEGNKTVINFVEKEVAGTYKANKNDITITLNGTNVELANLIRTDWANSDKNISNVSVSYHGDTYTLKNGNIICTHNTLKENESKRFNTITDEIVQQALNHIINADTAFIIGEQEYVISSYDVNNEKGYYVTTNLSYETGIASIYSFDKYKVDSKVDSKDYYIFLSNLTEYDGVNDREFSIIKDSSSGVETVDYKITKDEDNNLIAIQQKNQQNEFVNYVTPSIYSIRRYSGEDSMSLESKLAFQAVMQTMIADNL